MASAAGYEDPDGDEWEIINDDGFVHKRKKRSRIVPNATSSPAIRSLRRSTVEVEENAQTRLLELYPRTFSDAASSSEQNSTCRRIVDDLFSQAEGQEAIIRDVWSLCDVAEALCSAHEERMKQQLTNLPIWGQSPHELMAAL
ncbi:UNVERIFIED_CONTAM: hypothetical protein Sradi_6791200, partial [Sesamum radiatum]